MNSPFVHEQARGFASRILQVPGNDETRLRWAFETAHGRIPDQVVLDDAQAFVEIYRSRLENDEQSDANQTAAWSALARVLLTGNGFLFVD